MITPPLAARVVFCAALWLGLAAPTPAAERIIDYHSAIQIAADGSMQVSESILVEAAGDRIQRGIYRDFPTTYRDRNGNRVVVDFELLGVTRDGVAEPWHSENRFNGLRVYAGDGEVLLAPGRYTYVLTYRTTRQLGFFADYDELYWNVTGNGWGFEIERASAEVRLPQAVPVAQLAINGFTGAQGSSERAVIVELPEPGVARIASSRQLAAGEGLTLVFEFPKGIFAEPSAAQRAGWLLADNRALLLGGLGFVLVWLYYLRTWFRHGRDPKAGVIIPEYDAPEGLPPSALRYLMRMGHDQRAMTADLLHLAQSGYVEIAQPKKTFELRRSAKELPTSAILGGLLSALLPTAGDTRELTRGDHQALQGALLAHGKAIVERIGKDYFQLNLWRTLLGVAIGLGVVLIALLWQYDGDGIAAFMTACFSGVMLAMVPSLLRAAWRSARPTHRLGYGLGAVGALIVGLLLAAGVAALSSLTFALMVSALSLTHGAFVLLLPAYTVKGRKLLDRVEGFKQYLTVAEKDDLKRLDQPPLTGERFAEFLPYAMALDVEDAWAKRLVAAVGVAAAAEVTRRAVSSWYTGSGSFNPNTLARAMGSSFAGAISSASTAPGSSSGRSGSSGGGGGGGGGGGW